MRIPVAEVVLLLIGKGFKRSIGLIYFLFLNIIACQFRICAQNINRQMAVKILTELAKSRPDTSRVRMLTDLDKYNLFKPGEEKNDLDSASYFLEKARSLSDALHALKWQHECQSIAVIILMERGQTEAGRLQFLKVIKDFELTKDAEAEAMLNSI